MAESAHGVDLAVSKKLSRFLPPPESYDETTDNERRVSRQ